MYMYIYIYIYIHNQLLSKFLCAMIRSVVAGQLSLVLSQYQACNTLTAAV